MKISIGTGVLLAAGLVALQPMQAGTWTDFTAATSNTVTGTLTFGAQTVTVSYSGEIDLAQVNNVGTDYYAPSTTFAGGPTTSDIIEITGTTAEHTFTFSSPLLDPMIAIVSLGQPGTGVTYNFSAPFTILSQGAGNVYGGCSTCLTGSGTSALTGHEGDGIIQFSGTFSSISFTVTGGEFWNGFTIGADGVGAASTTPEPASIGLVGLALIGLGTARRVFRRQ